MLVVGKVLRVNLPFLQRLYLPSSIIGGLVGLAVMCAAGEAVPGEFRAAMQKTPGFLINVIFATIFLGSAIPKVHDFVLFALPQFCMGQIIAWGQYVLGLGLAGFVFVRVFDVPAAFGNLLEIGFEGGHGTVAGMAEAFTKQGWEEGAALDFLVASAVATIQPKVVAANWQPLTILVLAGAIWSVGCVLFLGPKLFLYAWFERSIAEFGQATGVTATGLMLLRTVDPENKTPAAMSFGYKQLLHEPFMGGGLWTALAKK